MIVAHFQETDVSSFCLVVGAVVGYRAWRRAQGLVGPLAVRRREAMRQAAFGAGLLVLGVVTGFFHIGT